MAFLPAGELWPVLCWVPVIAAGNLMFYTSTQTFPQWNGSSFISGTATTSLSRIVFASASWPWFLPFLGGCQN